MTRSPGRPPFARAAGEIAPIVVALFAALVATDPFDVRGKSHLLTILYKLSLGLWIATILILVSTVAIPSRDRGRKSYREAATLVCGAGALVLTVVMLSLGSSLASDTDNVQLVLAADNRAALDDLCGITKRQRLTGRIPTGSLNDQFIVLTLGEDVSGTKSGHALCDDVRIPVASIRAIREIH